jgi:hypothetical protein
MPRKRPKKLDLPQLSQPQSLEAGAQQGWGAGWQHEVAAGAHESQQSDFFDRRKRPKKLDLPCCSQQSPPQPQEVEAGAYACAGADKGAGATAAAGGFAACCGAGSAPAPTAVVSNKKTTFTGVFLR